MEKVRAYSDDMALLLAKADIPKDLQVKAYVGGLKLTLAARVAADEPKSIEEAKKAAIKHELMDESQARAIAALRPSANEMIAALGVQGYKVVPEEEEEREEMAALNTCLCDCHSYNANGELQVGYPQEKEEKQIGRGGAARGHGERGQWTQWRGDRGRSWRGRGNRGYRPGVGRGQGGLPTDAQTTPGGGNQSFR